MADNKLQTLAAVPTDGRAPKPSYADVAFAKGVTAHRPYIGDDLKPSTAWHTQFEDVNNDGLVDLFIAKGNVAEMPDFAAEGSQQPAAAAAGRQVRGSRATRPASPASSSRAGAALADFNLDGLIDLVVVNRLAGAALAQHQRQCRQLDRGQAAAAGRQTATRSAPGSRCGARSHCHAPRDHRRRRPCRRPSSAGGISASARPASAEVRVIWPDGDGKRLADASTAMASTSWSAASRPERWAPK